MYTCDLLKFTSKLDALNICGQGNCIVFGRTSITSPYNIKKAFP